MKNEYFSEIPLVEKPKLNENESFEFRQGALKGEWKVIEKDGLIVEGAFFKSPAPNGEIVIYIPGAPGDGVSLFEEKSVPELLKKGYDVFTARHGGIIPQKEQESLFHNEQRLEKGTVLGNDEMSVEKWVNEPKILMEFFSGQPVTIVSHSFGGLAVGNSITEMQKQYKDAEQNPINDIKRWINLSGVNYSVEAYRKKYKDGWRWYFENILVKSCNITDIEVELNNLEKAIEKSSQGLLEIRSDIDIRMISVNPVEDELVGEDAGVHLQEGLNQGLIIRDETAKKEELSEGSYVHDFTHLEPNTLLRLIKMRMSDTKHTVTLGKKDSKNPFTKNNNLNK